MRYELVNLAPGHFLDNQSYISVYETHENFLDIAIWPEKSRPESGDRDDFSIGEIWSDGHPQPTPLNWIAA